MQDYENLILDEPEKQKPKKPNLKKLLKGLGIPLGFMVGVAANFITWTLITIIGLVANGTHPDIILTILFTLLNITAILFLIFSLYKFYKPRLLFLNGLLSYFLGLTLYMKIMEKQSWNEIFHKPHLFSYPALSILIVELLILLAWIMIIKQKKRALGFILLIIIITLGLTTQ